MKIVSREHPKERRSHARIPSPRCSLSYPLATNDYLLSTSHYPLARRSSRRGVLLLLILALLAMFGLIAVAFVVLTGQAQRSAKSIERIDLAMDPPKNLLHQAAMQVFRGTNNPSSVMGPHSLLEDMYGNSFISEKTIIDVTPVCGGQVLKITSDVSKADIAQRGGCVITVTGLDPDNIAAQQSVYGQSTRIVYVVPDSSEFYVMAFPSGITALKKIKFTINGVPFSGTGFGYSGGTFNSTLALQPNNASNRNPEGGANEDYDAADFQNMLLAAQVHDSSGVMRTIPSLHRPALVRSVGSENANIVLRPLKANNAAFTGSNSIYNAGWDFSGTGTWGTGQWDVDNDGDGVPDSIWVDLGMPPRATNDGRLYKPLFAILCVDLDGRLNVNAHGSLAQATGGVLTAATTNTFYNAPTNTEAIARGQGIGPAEIDLGKLLANPGYVMAGSGGYQGRYGATGVPGIPELDPLSANKWFNYPGSFGSPIDPFGVGAIGLDQAGQPAYMKTGTYGYGSGVLNLPYEFNQGVNVPRGLPYLASGSKQNNPFSTSELERLLRPYDRDATGLPIRLAALTASSGNTLSATDLRLPERKTAFTTDSWDVPCPAVPSVSASSVSWKSILRALGDRCNTKSNWAHLLPAEVLNGLKMDINRPFGNGTTSGTGIVDDPTATKTADFHFDGADLVTTSLAARQLEARYLYVMMCLTSDLAYLNNKTGDYNKTARMLAQWAVNAVDFRDADSIMTPFDYDPAWANPSLPISDWNVTVGTSPRVWGCEKPGLLITETLAFHDRRTQDTANETDYASEKSDPGRTKGGFTTDKDTTTEKIKDASYDQAYRPQGSLFVELYNPASSNESHCQDLYTASGDIDLTKKCGNSPVWRLIIAASSDSNPQPDPDDPDSTVTPEREVYFSAPSAPTSTQFYPSKSPTVSLGPGGYAIIGPGEKNAAASDVTYIGLPKNTTGTTDRRKIDLASSATQLVKNNTNSPADPASGIGAIKTVAIDSPRRLSVSEPLDGYDGYETASKPDYNDDGKYEVPYDEPFDIRRSDGGQTYFIANGTYPKYRVVYLQRLANPLSKYEPDKTSPDYNPYRTVDMMAVDVTSFNGAAKDTGNANTEGQPGDDPQLPENAPSPMIETHFQSRQRGENNDVLTSKLNANMNLWKQEPGDKPLEVFKAMGDAKTDNATYFFEKDLKHSLGYLNQPFDAPAVASPYTGFPQKPFPWLTWNNRPFVSPLELMLVPAVRSSELLVNASSSSAAKSAGDANYNKYFNILKSSDSTANLYGNLDGANVPYPHLLNFFQSNASTIGTNGTDSAQFHRILEYLNVPSPFVSADVQTFPSTPESPFLPPFNRISNYREPGRINLNTIYSPYVFNGLMAGFPAMATNDFWQKFVASRQGISTATNDVLPTSTASSLPSEFAHPFRSFSGWTYTPTTLRPADASPFNREINSTLLRADPTDSTRPLFQFDTKDVKLKTYAADYNNPDRNPFFRYQSLSRLGNLVTTRSNVYAVWITVGYFEWTKNTSTGNMELGQELGVDTGEIDRHRAFYIFDRSIPVGFQRGQDLNVEKAILVDRYIE